MNNQEDAIGKVIVDRAVKVHRELGPGLFERVYEAALTYELNAAGLTVERQVAIPVAYRGVSLEEGFRADMLINDLVIIELKSVEEVSGVHHKQIQTYLKLAKKRLGYIINFGQSLMKSGIVRVVNGLPDDMSWR
ncbi:MAG: hypothetical protein DHS20C11_16780 [Lysobacteraceae bacterium]|nr:MAG: hypothetical protein DHS20C11_16780 [Xanthomonadaceae bacterium]